MAAAVAKEDDEPAPKRLKAGDATAVAARAGDAADPSLRSNAALVLPAAGAGSKRTRGAVDDNAAPAAGVVAAAGAGVAAAADDSDDDFGPARPAGAGVDEKQRKPKPKFSAAQLAQFAQHAARLPSAEMYEKSFMHRDTLTAICVTSGGTDFVVTGSVDGHLKFWKKTADGIEFAKQFKAHLGPVTALAASADGFLLCSISTDRTVKVFDVVTFDMIHIIRLSAAVSPFLPLACAWVHPSKSARGRIALSDSATGDIRIYRPEGGAEPLHTVKLHSQPVTHMVFNEKFNAVVSIDAGGFVEYWDPETLEFPAAATGAAAAGAGAGAGAGARKQKLQFQHQSETDLYEFAKNKTVPTSLALSHDGRYMALMGRDRLVRVFNFASGKLYRVFDEGLSVYEKQQLGSNPQYKLDNIDFGRRMAVERDLDRAYKPPDKAIIAAAASGAPLPPPPSNVVFDESGTFVLYPTLIGIKVVNFHTNKLVRILGKVENTERFLCLALFQGVPKTYGLSATADSNAGLIASSGNAISVRQEDPMLFAGAYKKNRFFWFSKREPKDDAAPGQGRDVYNEKPIKDVQKLVAQSAAATGSVVTIHTTMGDITVELYPSECPKTVENFVTHSKNGYYNNTIFHRVIKDFMIQCGDPTGTGLGGESIWGGEFEDEISPKLKHDRAGVVSMANSGPRTNGSQFFITTVPTLWLDGKHTVFGRVTKGMDVVHNIEKVRTEKNGKPETPIKIMNIDLQK